MTFSDSQTRFKDFEGLFSEPEAPEITFDEADLLSVLQDVRRGGPHAI
jgi:hypothetical protein